MLIVFFFFFQKASYDQGGLKESLRTKKRCHGTGQHAYFANISTGKEQADGVKG